jgi:hypothetical protein
LKGAIGLLAATLLAALLAAAPACARSWPQGDPDAVVRSVLAQAAYRTEKTAAQPPQPTLLEQIWKAVRTWLRAHLGFVRRLFHGARATGNLLGVIALVAVGAALIAIGARLVALLARPKAPVNDEGTGLPALGRARSAAQWRAFAMEAAARAEYNAAVTALFLAALQLLDESGVLHFDAARTPGEYRRLVRSALRGGAPAFDGLAGGFLNVTYGERRAGLEEYDAAQRSYAAFAPLVAQP